MKMLLDIIPELLITKTLDDVVGCVEYAALKSAINCCDGNRTQMGLHLGLDRNTVRKKLIAYDLYSYCLEVAAKVQADNVRRMSHVDIESR